MTPLTAFKPTSAPLKVAIIGLGRMGKNHLRVLSTLPEVEVVLLVDHKIDQLNLDASIAQLSEYNATANNFDAMVIATPTSSHAELFMQVAEHCNKIFLEKPLAQTLEEAQMLKAIVAKRAILLMTGFIERFNPAFQTLQQVLAQSSRLLSLDFYRTGRGSARITDVDIVVDLMIHDLDLALLLAGQANSVQAQGLCLYQQLDHVHASVHHKGGVLTHFHASRISDKKIRIIQATCEDCLIECDLLNKSMTCYLQGQQAAQRIEVPQQDALTLQLQAFVQACRNAPSHNAVHSQIASINAGYEAMWLCEAIQKKAYAARF